MKKSKALPKKAGLCFFYGEKAELRARFSITLSRNRPTFKHFKPFRFLLRSPVLFVLDIGNTRAKAALFDGQRLARKAVWPEWPDVELADWLGDDRPAATLFSSVAEPDTAPYRVLRETLAARELGPDTPLPFENAYRTPQTLGKDRLAAAAGALALFPGRHCLVIDCGTCIKYELVAADRRYLGGNIAPGAAMRIEAMHHFTARLPRVPMEIPGNFVGDSTTTALQNGALRGAALEIEGFAALFRQKLEPLQVMLTGGDADLFYPLLAEKIDALSVEPDLTLYGLNYILQFNLPKTSPGI